MTAFFVRSPARIKCKQHTAMIAILVVAIATSHAFAQRTVLRSSVFDLGSGFPSAANSRLQSILGQNFVGVTGAGNVVVTGGFLVDSLSWNRVTGIDGTGSRDLPKAFALLQNFPNPFNPSTVISFRLPVASNVRIVVYDILGREVSVIVNERRPAGSYAERFDASALASGVYLYRFTAGGFVQTRKMIVVR
jgi:hypothetical protein